MSTPTISQIMGKDSYMVPELKEECKKRGITGYSKLKKKALEDKIMESSNHAVQKEDGNEDVKTELVNEETPERIAPLHYDIEFKYYGLSIREIKIISMYEKNGNQEKIEKSLEDEINSNDKYKFGDIVTTVDWLKYQDQSKPCIDCCYGLICKNGDSKQIMPLYNLMTSDRFINEHPYLKNINYDEVITTINKKDCIEPYESPLTILSELYSKLNNKSEISDKIQELTDSCRPDIVLSTLEVLEVDF